MNTQTDSATIARAYMAWAAVCVIWGTTYLAIKIALETIPPFLMGGLRYTIAGTMLAVILRMQGHLLPSPRHWGRLAIVGFLMLGLGNGGVVWAEQSVPSGLTAVLIATTPFWMLGVDALYPGGKKPHARQWIGLAIGFTGILVLVWPDIAEGGAGARAFAGGVLALQIACAGWAVASAYTKRHVLPRDVLGSAAMQMIFGGLSLLIGGTLTHEWPALSFNGKTSLMFVYLTLAGSVVAFTAYSYALKHLDVAIVSLYTYINPIIAVLLGTLLLDEPFHLRMLIAAAIILFGMAIVSGRRPFGRRPVGPAAG